MHAHSTFDESFSLCSFYRWRSCCLVPHPFSLILVLNIHLSFMDRFRWIQSIRTQRIWPCQTAGSRIERKFIHRIHPTMRWSIHIAAAPSNYKICKHDTLLHFISFSRGPLVWSFVFIGHVRIAPHTHTRFRQTHHFDFCVSLAQPQEDKVFSVLSHEHRK